MTPDEINAMDDDTLSRKCAEAMGTEPHWPIDCMNHAMQLVERAREWGSSFMLDDVDFAPRWEASFHPSNPNRRFGAVSDNPAVAISRAFLLLCEARKANP